MFKHVANIIFSLSLLLSLGSCRMSGGGSFGGSGMSSGFDTGGGTGKPDRELVEAYDGGKLMSYDIPIHDNALSIHKKNKVDADIKRVNFKEFFPKEIREIISGNDISSEAMAIATFTLDSLNMYKNIEYSTSGTSLKNDVAVVNVLTVHSNGTCNGEVKRVEDDAEIYIECLKNDSETLYIVDEVIDD